MKIYSKSKEDIELALKWSRGEIGTVEVAKYLGYNKKSRGGVYNFLALCLRQYLLIHK